MHDTKRSLAFWLIIGFLSVALVLLLMGQTMALVDYDLAVQLGLQESVNEVGGYGIQVNRAFGAGDTIVYIPLITLSIIGLILRKRWSLLTTAAAMGISAYWATTIASMLFFLPGAPGYSLEPGLEYWIFMAAFSLRVFLPRRLIDAHLSPVDALPLTANHAGKPVNLIYKSCSNE